MWLLVGLDRKLVCVIEKDREGKREIERNGETGVSVCVQDRVREWKGEIKGYAGKREKERERKREKERERERKRDIVCVSVCKCV